MPAVWADHDRLEQVLVNLMDNAVRHNPEQTSVHVRAVPLDAQTITITVTDDGIGLPDDFEDMTEGTSQRGGATAGAGLGLSISRAIVAAHGGALRLERPERGTRWHVDLPIAGADADADPATAAAPDG
jgi:signal transduction histidine kinase